MSIGLDRLLADIERLPADDLATDACEWLGAAVARQVDISPRLAAIVMAHCQITAEQLRAVVDRHLLRRDLAAKVRACRAAERQVDTAQRRVMQAVQRRDQLAAHAAPLVHTARDAWHRLLSDEALSPQQADLWRGVQERHAAEQALLDDATERHRIAELRLASVQEQTQAAARSRACQGTATARQRYRLDEIAAAVDALRDEIDDRQLRVAAAKADIEHTTSDLTRDIWHDG